jgi:hypothetical protein
VYLAIAQVAIKYFISKKYKNQSTQQLLSSNNTTTISHYTLHAHAHYMHITTHTTSITHNTQNDNNRCRIDPPRLLIVDCDSLATLGSNWQPQTHCPTAITGRVNKTRRDG